MTRTMRRGGGAAAAGAAVAGGAVATDGTESKTLGVAAGLQEAAEPPADASGVCIALIIRTVAARLPPVSKMRAPIEA